MYKFLCSLVCLLVLFLSLSCDSGNTPYESDVRLIVRNDVSLVRTDWKQSSYPIHLTDSIPRGTTHWYTPEDMYAVNDMYNSDVAPSNGVIPVFRIVKDDSNEATWGGITTYIGPVEYRGLPQERFLLLDTTQYINIRMKKTAHTTIHFNFGKINEDINGNNIYDTENFFYVDKDLDVGLDGLSDPNEPGYNPVTNPDPNGDNFYFRGYGKCPLPPDSCESVNWDDPDDPHYYKYLNGTEGNRMDILQYGLPDREGFIYSFNATNQYYSFTVAPGDNTYIVQNSEHNGWVTYRFPFRDSLAADLVDDQDGGLFDLVKPAMRNLRIVVESDGSGQVDDTVEIAHIYFEQDNIINPADTLQEQYSLNFIRDSEYEQARAFYLNFPDQMVSGDSITHLFLYRELQVVDGGDNMPADMYVDPSDTTFHQSENASAIIVEQISPEEYLYYQDLSNNNRYVMFNSRQRTNTHIGCYIEYMRASDDSLITVGDISTDTLQLKMLFRPEKVSSPSDYTWNYMWRNCYNIGRNNMLATMQIELFKGLPGTEYDTANLSYQDALNNQSYLTITGLDQYNVMGVNVPDGMIDDRFEIYHPGFGLLILPHPRPFDTDTTFSFSDGSESDPLLDRVPTLYDYNSKTELHGNSKYYFRVITRNY